VFVLCVMLTVTAYLVGFRYDKLSAYVKKYRNSRRYTGGFIFGVCLGLSVGVKPRHWQGGRTLMGYTRATGGVPVPVCNLDSNFIFWGLPIWV